MNFLLSPEQQMLADTAARFVETEYGFETRRKRMTEPSHHALGYSQQLWSKMAEMGLFALNVPEAHGGIGADSVETLIVMEALGRGLVLEPFLATGVVAPRVIASHGTPQQQDRFLGAIAAGELRFALALLEPNGRFDLDAVSCRLEPDGESWRLTGHKAVVLHGDSADWLLVSARNEQGLCLLLVDAKSEGVTAVGSPTIDGQRSAEVHFERVVVATDCVLAQGAHVPALLEWTVDQAVAGLAAEAVGVMGRLTELTCEYLATRKQFGVPIGSFQALQHRAADMRIAVEQARALALMAAARVGSSDAIERCRAVSAAKVMVGRSGRFVGQQATQLHGGMGMTNEMACGHYFKRLTAIDMSWGNSDHHLERFAEHL